MLFLNTTVADGEGVVIDSEIRLLPCPHCNELIPVDCVFCPKCGSYVKGELKRRELRYIRCEYCDYIIGGEEPYSQEKCARCGKVFYLCEDCKEWYELQLEDRHVTEMYCCKHWILYMFDKILFFLRFHFKGYDFLP